MKKIAIIIPGGIGVGHFNQGIPILELFLQKLGQYFELWVFPLGTINEGYLPKHFKICPINLPYTAPLFQRMMKTYREIKAHHQQKPFDLLHGIWTYPAGFLATLLGKRWGVKSLISVQGGGLANIKAIRYGGRQSRLNQFFVDWSLRNANLLSAESQYQVHLIKLESIRARVKVIPYGVDSTRFKFTPKTLKSPIQLVHIANLNLVKDQPTLIRAFGIIAEKKDAQLTIVGPDYLNGAIQQLVQDLEVEEKVKFEGMVKHENIPDYLANAHILLHTSMHEGMPLVAVEAMASGVVVCGTNVGIIADLSPVCCLSVPVGDHEGLANKVLGLIENPVHFQTLQQQALAWTRAHDIEWTINQFKALYE